jgi:putative nucleotidyltransferase with HDIG domain
MVTPKLCLEEAQNVVNDLVDTALMEGDIAIHALNGNRSSDTDYQHPLNVTVLALMLAKSIDMSKDEARILGLTAILHDIGKAEVSDKVLLKKDPLTHSELTHYQQHTDFGTRMIKDLGLSARFGKIVAQHHEFMDGSGYPLGLKADKIDPLAKVIVLVNSYDNLCNPSNPAQAKTPYEALGAMFAQQRHKFDEDLLKRLIKCLGIYPPGSIVRLSNNKYAKVVSVNPNQPLKPFVLMFHIKNQVEETQLIDLRHETTLNITQCIKPNQTPAEILKFISQRKRVCYFLDSALEAA